MSRKRRKLEEVKCPVADCKVTTEGKGKMTKHLWEDHKIGHKCEVKDCPFNSNNSGSLNIHMWQVHGLGEGQMHPCDQEPCEWTFKTKGDLTKHLWQVHGKYYKCDVDACDFKTTTNKSLQKHKINIHNLGKFEIIKCTQGNCDYTVKHQTQLKRHLWLVHTVEGMGKYFPCIVPGCNHKAKLYSLLKQHLWRYHTLPGYGNWYKCEEKFCEYKTKCKADLIQHTKIRHMTAPKEKSKKEEILVKRALIHGEIRHEDEFRVKFDNVPDREYARIDFVIARGELIMFLLEVDEKQHVCQYTVLEECLRMVEGTKALVLTHPNVEHFVWIRFNPHNFRKNGVLIKDVSKEDRCKVLVEFMKTYEPKKKMEVAYMFYNSVGDKPCVFDKPGYYPELQECAYVVA
jgi:hypothetical protein